MLTIKSRSEKMEMGKKGLVFLLLIIIVGVILLGYFFIKYFNIELVVKATPKQKVNSFQQCLDAGYDVSNSKPRQCKSFDGKVFVEQAKYLEDLSCSSNADCVLVNSDLGYACCWIGACDHKDYSESKWVAVNKDKFSSERSLNCQKPEDCGPAPGCSVMVLDNYEAKCIESKCQKVIKEG